MSFFILFTKIGTSKKFEIKYRSVKLIDTRVFRTNIHNIQSFLTRRPEEKDKIYITIVGITEMNYFLTEESQ